jgi:hypothetical protein
LLLPTISRHVGCAGITRAGPSALATFEEKKDIMFSPLRLSLGMGVLALAGICTPALAQERADGADQPDGARVIKHRINRHGSDYVVGSAEKGFSLTTGGTGTVTPAITHHGGPVMAGTVNAYVIWYGNWNQTNGSDNPAGQQIVRDFLNNIGGSAYFNLNQTYSIAGQNITGAVSLGGETTDTGSRGTRLRDNDIQTIVTAKISSGALPYDANGVYFVLTSSNVSEQSGFCTRYCGWHTAATPSVGHIKYSFVGNANRCLSSCAAQSVGPNGNAGVDGMISVIVHELEEAVSDPDLNAWYDSGGAENADKCAWTFGHAQYQTANGAWANVHLGSRDYLIQRNLQHLSAGDKCMMSSTQN